MKILNRDLAAAGIPKVDERGRTVDVHALRHTFGTLLSKGGVAPRTAQEVMRHSSIDLTMKTYTDPRLLDVAGAMEALPDLALDPAAAQSQAMTGTDGADPPPRKLVPDLVPTTGNSRESRSNTDKSSDTPRRRPRTEDQVQVFDNDKDRRPLSSADNGRHDRQESGRLDLNQRPLDPQRTQRHSAAAVMAAISNCRETCYDDLG